MTIEEQKLAVCEKLSDLLFEQRKQYYWKQQKDYSCRTHHPVNWPTEGLQVCHEAEKLLTDEEWIAYLMHLHGDIHIGASRKQVSATYEQRLEALCRVWWPERFTQ